MEFVPKELVDTEEFLQEGQATQGTLEKKKNNLEMKATTYTLINGYLYKLGPHNILH